MKSENPHRAVVILAVAAAALATVSAFLADRRGGIDEIGLVNPPYMKLHYGKLTYPVHGYPDAMFVHPPTHYALIAFFLRLGFSLYYAEAVPTFLTMILCILLIVRSPLLPTVKMGLLYGLAIASVIFDPLAFENYGMRPEHQLAAALLAGLVLLEWARIDGWSKVMLFAGAATVVFAAGLQYYAWPAVLTVGVYAVRVLADLGRCKARRPLAALTAGALAIGIPYMALFVSPQAHAIRGMLNSTKVENAANPLVTHVAAYHAMAGLHLVTAPVAFAFRLGVPMVLVSTVLFLAVRATRILALAALPVQLSLLFFAWHKHAYYYYHEIQLFCAAMVVIGLFLVDHYLFKLKRPRLRAFLWYGTAVTCAVHVWITGTSYKTLHWSLQPRVHELEIARAAGREILGPKARVGSRIGPWYSSGGAYWHRVTPDLLWNRLPPTFNVTTYLSNFDAIAEGQHMSFETRNGRGQNIASWYADGSWKLRGFFFAEMNPEISYLLFTSNHSKPVTGFGLTEGRMYKFTEDSTGDQAFTSLVCPIDPAVCTVAEGKAQHLQWSLRCPWYARDTLFLSVIFQPEQPGRFERDAVVNVLLPAAKSRAYVDSHRECGQIAEIRGSLAEVDKQALITKLRREDRPMQFYERTIDMPGVQRIIGEPPPLDAMRLADAIPLDRMKLVNHRAVIVPGKSPKVITAPGMGAYAASIPINLPTVFSPCWIHFRVTVSKGTVGIGVLSREKRNFLTEPPLVPAGQLPLDVYIALPSSVGADEVIVRSAEENTSSEITLLGAEFWHK